ncbi:MAG: DUF1566 domain-containing protein [Nitrospinales bacterium]
MGKFSGYKYLFFSILLISFAADECFGDVYEAPPYIPPPPPETKVHLTDNEDGTITDGNGLMWTKLDSYADLNRCLNWYDSEKYVQKLSTGGYTDWRMPSTVELYGIYDDTIENNMSWDHNSENPLRLSKLFADGAAHWYWSGEREETKLANCCAPSFYFVKGFTNTRRLNVCDNGGVRAVRKIGQN